MAVGWFKRKQIVGACIQSKKRLAAAGNHFIHNQDLDGEYQLRQAIEIITNGLNADGYFGVACDFDMLMNELDDEKLSAIYLQIDKVDKIYSNPGKNNSNIESQRSEIELMFRLMKVELG
jgi:hypothetical protein